MNKNLPFDLVKDEDFRKMCSALSPHFKNQSKRGLMGELYDITREKRQSVRELFEKLGKAAITHDSWTSKNSQTFASLSSYTMVEHLQYVRALGYA